MRGSHGMTVSRTSQGRRYRDVSDLRTQFQCEYRLYLSQKKRSRPSQVAWQGTKLHQKVKLRAEGASAGSTKVRAAVVLVTILAAILWILG